MALREVGTDGHGFELFAAPNDVNGNARYVVHYSTIPFDGVAEPGIDGFYANQLAHIEHAKKRLNGRIYRGRDFGGGIVFQAYAGDPIRHVLAAIAGVSARELRR